MSVLGKNSSKTFEKFRLVLRFYISIFLFGNRPIDHCFHLSDRKVQYNVSVPKTYEDLLLALNLLACPNDNGFSKLKNQKQFHKMHRVCFAVT